MENFILEENLEFLKDLQNYSLESKLLTAQLYSSRIEGIAEIEVKDIMKQNITPFEIETFTLFSILYDNMGNTTPITGKAFSDAINGIRNYHSLLWKKYENSNDFANAFIMISGLTQFATQGSVLFKLFRGDYFFNFSNEAINVKELFKEKFGIYYDDLAVSAYLLYMGTSLHSQNTHGVDFCKECTRIAFSNKKVLDVISISKEEYLKELKLLYGDCIEDYYYGLKIQYLFPVISDNSGYYVPSPYLVVNAVTESLYNRFTEGNNELRALLGKEVIESYLYDIYSTLPKCNWISREITYRDGKIKSPDVLVEENGYVIMFDTKSKSPGLKLRKFDEKAIETEVRIFAENIIQIYHQITNYINGEYELGHRFERCNIFGVSVALEDSFVSRKMIYDKVFQILSENENINSPTEFEYIHSHIKIISLREIENLVLRGKGISTLLAKNACDKNKWDDYNIILEEFEGTFPPIFNEFFIKLNQKIMHI